MSENRKQTAVEWFKQEFFSYADPYPYFSEDDKWVITEREFLELIEKAREIFKVQIEEAWYDGCSNGSTICSQRSDLPAEDYYNETYISE